MLPSFDTARLSLRPYASTDEDRFVALFGDEDVARWVGDGPQSEEDNRAKFGRLLSDVYPNRRFEVWAVWSGSDYVGHAEIKHTQALDGHEIIYILARAHWRQGLGSELAEGITRYGYESLGLRSVHATVDARNTASLAVLARLGFRHVRDKTESNGSTTRVLSHDGSSHGSPATSAE